MNYKKISIELYKGDITTLPVDAVVNAANNKLSVGGGVDGAIHKAAGPELAQACIRLGGCKTGEAKITYGYKLPAKFVIHTVGPIYGHMDGMEASYLEDCYKNSLAVADNHNVTSIAFPAIATGSYGFPIHEAVPIALESVKEYIDSHPATKLQKVYFVCYTQSDLELYKSYISEIF